MSLAAERSPDRPGSRRPFKAIGCADGTEFIVGFFDDDTRAHLQIDGGPVTLRLNALRCPARAMRAEALR